MTSSQETTRKNDFDLTNNASSNWTLVLSEIRNFDSLYGFINIHLNDEQFTDRVGVMIKRRKVSNKDNIADA